MAERNIKTLLIIIAEIVYSLAIAAWFIQPIFFPMGTGGLNPFTLAWQIVPVPSTAIVQFILVLIVVWIAPVIAVWKIASPFLARVLPTYSDSRRMLPIILNIVATSAILATQVIHAMAFAKGFYYISAMFIGLLAMLVVTLAWNSINIVRLIQQLGTRDANYSLYREFREKLKQEGQKSQLTRWGIQRRLVVSFVAIIFIIIIALSGILLNDFSKTLLEAVNQNGKTLAERTASILKTSLGDSIAIDDYLSIESGKNKANEVSPFNSLSFYKRNANTNNFALSAGTDPKQIGKQVKSISVPDLKTTISRDISDGQQMEFLSPIVLSGKYIGYISAIYDKEIILAPYYRTQAKVFIIALLAIYLSIFITYLFGRNIVIPILFLRMSVNNISTTLGQMIRGDRKISADGLQYSDIVGTRDEIKGLSLEIGNMATVIRGVLPYVSASTLKHSERAQPSTEKRDLAFLFTDIRGFTTLCEGLEPDEVVKMLNEYLELQSSIILENGGDIDKFVGDEIMAMFEGPEKDLHACKAALGIAKAMAEQRAKSEAAKDRVITIGIGINSGPVVFGSVGARERMDFTSIGDTVNLAARLEGANKTYGTKTLIAESVYAQVKSELLCREIDLMTVKGKNQPVRIYEIMGELDSVSKPIQKLCEYFAAGLKAYRAKDWDRAEKIFSALGKEYQDEPSKIFLQRVALFRTRELPADWDGVFNLTVK